jgi:hypothetical protein
MNNNKKNEEENFSSNLNDENIHILGLDLDKKEITLVDKLKEILQERILLNNSNVFTCLNCPNILEHVSFFKI